MLEWEATGATWSVSSLRLARTMAGSFGCASGRDCASAHPVSNAPPRKERIEILHRALISGANCIQSTIVLPANRVELCNSLSGRTDLGSPPLVRLTEYVKMPALCGSVAQIVKNLAGVRKITPRV